MSKTTVYRCKVNTVSLVYFVVVVTLLVISLYKPESFYLKVALFLVSVEALAKVYMFFVGQSKGDAFSVTFLWPWLVLFLLFKNEAPFIAGMYLMTYVLREWFLYRGNL